jgi:hypothetical protein
MTTRELLPLYRASNQVGALQGRLRLLAGTLPPDPPDLRDTVTRAADLLDQADTLLVGLFNEHAPQPRGRSA